MHVLAEIGRVKRDAPLESVEEEHGVGCWLDELEYSQSPGRRVIDFVVCQYRFTKPPVLGPGRRRVSPPHNTADRKSHGLCDGCSKALRRLLPLSLALLVGLRRTVGREKSTWGSKYGYHLDMLATETRTRVRILFDGRN